MPAYRLIALLLAPLCAALPLRADPLSPNERQRVDDATRRGLAYLARSQRPDGSFPTVDYGQPGLTALCALAFLSSGHLPGEGEYGDALLRATDYIFQSQQANGAIARYLPNPGVIDGAHQAALYNHGISALFLAELYGMTDAQRNAQIGPAIEKAIAFTSLRLPGAKRQIDHGGWRYYQAHNDGVSADLSITSWQLIFLRSAKNAGFEVPTFLIDEGVAYVQRCYVPDERVFLYYPNYPNPNVRIRRAMTAAGIVTLAMAGLHDTPMAADAARTLRTYRFDRYNGPQFGASDRYHYSAFYSVWAAHQIGGDTLDQMYPHIAHHLVANQSSNGGWLPETREEKYGPHYSTALALLALNVPQSMLPIFQR